MEKWLEDACENIDAAVFTGDTLESPEDVEVLEGYIGRWKRAIQSHEENQEANVGDKRVEELTFYVNRVFNSERWLLIDPLEAILSALTVLKIPKATFEENLSEILKKL